MAASFVSMRFCRNCNNMLYPKENKEDGAKELQFYCRICDHKEAAAELEHCVYRHEIVERAGAKINISDDLVSDPTLPRTTDVSCPRNCVDAQFGGSSPVVFFQKPGRRPDEPMTLYFICTKCREQWSQDKEKA
eukprot:tig00000970_g5844.t1